METWWNAMMTFEKVYWFIAIIGGSILAIQLILAMFGLSHSGDVDISSHDNIDPSHHDISGPHFQLLTIRNIVAFFAMFGWSGIALIHSHANKIITMLMSFVCGLIMMVLTGLLFYFIMKLSRSGNMDINESVGKTGTAYYPIPATNSGQGRVNIVLNGQVRELNAMTMGPKIESGMPVKVLRVLNNILIVERS